MMNKYKLLGAVVISALFGSELVAQTSYSWSPAGPVLSAGRSRNLIIDKNDKNVLYVGSVSSGIFKSTDAAANWAPINDQGTVRNISYLAQAADNTIYASTGEGFLRFTARSRAQPGTGLYKLVGNDLVQVQPASVTGSIITRIACHPTNPNNIALAGINGLLISTDGGATFTQASGDIAPTATALTVAYDNVGNIYATATTLSNGGGVEIYKSAGGNPTLFAKITPTSSILPTTNYGRIEFAIANSNNATIYASIAKPTNPAITNNSSSASLLGFFVSKDGGATWTLILEGSPQLDPLSNGGSINSGDYAHNVIVNPLNDNQVFIGSYKLYGWFKDQTGPEGIGTWVPFGNEFALNTPLYLRHNIHDIKISTTGSNFDAFYFVTDAGVYKSSDNLTSFQPFFKGLGTAQYNSISIASFPKTANNNNTLVPYSGYIAGTGGNGISFFSGNYPLVSNEINYLSGDFFGAQYSRISPNTAYFASSNSNLYIAADINVNDPNLMNASHLATKCNQEPAINSIDFRGISNGGSTTEGVYVNNSFATTGTPFKLWESDGSLNTIDSAMFFNDSISVLIPVTTSTLSPTASFAVNLIKPQKSAIIDKITIRTFTVGIPNGNKSACFDFTTKTYSATQKATIEFGGATSATSVPTSYTLTGLTSTVINAVNSYSLNAKDGIDIINFELPVNPLTPVITFTNEYQFVRVGVTVFYRYNAGSKIIVTNENITSRPFKDSLSLPANISWSFNNVGTNSLSPVSTAEPTKFKMPANSRLAILNDKGVLVSKRPLNINDPQKFQIVSCTGALATNASTYTAGQMTVVGLPYILNWSPDGKSIYYATSNSVTSTYNIYKVNVGTSIHDFAIDDYRGAYYSGCVNGTRTSPTAFTFTTNVNSKFRTTLLGTFNEKITHISVSDNNKTLLLTTSDKSGPGKRIYVSSSNVDLNNVDNTNVTFTDKTNNLPQVEVYCSLFEFSNNNHVLVGTENGIYATDDITAASPNWFSANNNMLPNVQIFDIQQQKLNSWESYNSGIIYIATNGRGAWVNKDYLTSTVIGVNEYEVKAKNTGLALYPNPTNGMVTLNYYANDNEKIIINVMDINGKTLKAEALSGLKNGYTDHQLDVSELVNGVYIVNVTSSLGVKRVAKLIISK